jgi:penicillin-binding protein 1A
METKSPKSKTTNTIIKILWIGGLLSILLPLVFVFLVAKNIIGDKLPPTKQLENPETSLATEIFSKDGVVLGKYYAQNRSKVEYDDLSPNLVNALVATEDARFYNHSGIDFKALLRVAVKTVLAGKKSSGGGSTITQQLAKNLFPRKKLNKFQMLVRKIQEWVLATRLERLYTKNEIIAMYFNVVEFGHQAVGIKSATYTFFNKAPDQVNIEEAALLVGMLKAPSYYSPKSRPNNALNRRNVVLSQMEKAEFIDENAYKVLSNKPIVLDFKTESHADGLATYFREHLRKWLSDWAREKGYDIYSDGLKVYTTLDSRLQTYAEEAVYQHMKDLQKQFYAHHKGRVPWKDNPEIIEKTKKRCNRYLEMQADGATEEEINKAFNKKINMSVFSYRGEIDTLMSPMDSIIYYKYLLRSGFAVMDPVNGEIRAWVGGINQKYMQYDHVLGQRQVGSTFKPFVYYTGLKQNFGPCHSYPNEKIIWEEYDNWTPRNSDGKYGGMMTLKDGLAKSVNTITVQLMKEVKIINVIETARQMGIRSKLEKVPSLSLGVADISLLEMLGAFNTFNSNGQYSEPIFVTRIEDKNGKVLDQFSAKTTEVLDPLKNYVMIEMLRGVNLRGTGWRLRGRYGFEGASAGKTGTTQQNSDGWYMGLTPQLTGGAWVGGEERAVRFYSTNLGQGASTALPIWAFFLKKAYADPSLGLDLKKDWKKPDGEIPFELDCKNAEVTNELPDEF